MKLREIVAVLLRDCLLILEGVLDVCNGQREVCLIDIHRIYEELNISVVGKLLRLPVVRDSAGIETCGSRVVLIAGQGEARKLDGLCIKEGNLWITVH